jgi:hypothetical protein
VLVRRLGLIDEKARQQRHHDCVTNQFTAHNGSYASLVIIEPNVDVFRTALMRLHHGGWTRVRLPGRDPDKNDPSFENPARERSELAGRPGRAGHGGRAKPDCQFRCLAAPPK